MTSAAMRQIEADLIQDGHHRISGTDEAGRGPLAGPVCVATVILNPLRIPEGLRDSKKVGAKQRERLYHEIMATALDVSTAYASVDEIEEMNVLEATKLGMLRSLAGLRIAPDFALVDGPHLPGPTVFPARAVVDGDDKSYSIAAASLVAKYRQVEAIMEIHRLHPEYGFDRHKGYGTRQHLEALAKHGPTPWHRASFRPVRLAARARAADRADAG